MSKINDGGPAFARPIVIPNNLGIGFDACRAQEGMSLRDYFAGQVMAGWFNLNAANTKSDMDGMAIKCWQMADSMLGMARDRDTSQ